jgi:hypothetical protein
VVNVGVENLAMKIFFSILISFVTLTAMADHTLLTLTINNIGTNSFAFGENQLLLEGQFGSSAGYFGAYNTNTATATSGGSAVYDFDIINYDPTWTGPVTLYDLCSGTIVVAGGGTAYTVSFDPDNCTATTNVTIVYTNYTFCADNTDASRIMQVTWNYNGSVVKQSVLTPGQSDCWTTPNIEVSPTPQNFTESTVSTFPTLINPSTDGNTNGQITFNSPPPTTSSNSGSGGSGSGNGSGGTGGGQTNTLSSSSPSQIAPTNLVTFPTPVGTASESTLSSGFQLLHGDLLNVIAGQKIQNDSINSGFFSVTDELGDILTYVRSNTDQMPTLISAVTNLGHIAGGTNYFNSSSNVWVQNWPTNHQSNTNLNQEATQQGISNLLAQIATNTSPQTNGSSGMWSLIPNTATNADAATAAATAAEGEYGMTAFLTALTPSIPADGIQSVDMTMNFCGQTIDLDPVHMFPSVANACYIGTKIIAELLFLLEIGRMFWSLVQTKASTSSGGVPDLEVIGGFEALTFGAEGGGNFIGAIVAVIVPFVFILIWSVAMAYLFSNIGVSVSEAMNITAFSSAMSGGWYLLTSFIPVNLLFTLLCTRITLQFTMAKIVSIAANATRFLWGK